MGFISGIIITTIFFPRKMDTCKQKEPNRFSKTINKKKKTTKEIIANPQTYKNI